MALAGKPAEAFNEFEDVRTYIVSTSLEVQKRNSHAVRAFEALTRFYREHALILFRLAKNLAGGKLVLGGGTYLLNPQLSCIRRTLLYVDAILVPDPVFPWIESARKEEKFGRVRQIQAIWHALQLRPLVDADLPYLPLFMFPSFEKSLEERDPKTLHGIAALALAVFNTSSGMRLQSIEEMMEFSESKPAEFLNTVETHQLFVGPEQDLDDKSIKTAVRLYREHSKRFRSEHYVKLIDSAADSRVACNGMVERFTPQYHLLENSEELHAHPLLPLPVHGHYYGLSARAFEKHLEQERLISEESVMAIRALAQPQFAWLGNVPIEEIVRLRQENQNEQFRKRLGDITSALNRATVNDVGRLCGELSRALSAMLAEHRTEVERVQREYARKHGLTAAGSLVTAAAVFIPALAPLLGLPVAIGLGAKYAKDKVDEMGKLSEASRSLMGVLASTRQAHGKSDA